MLNVESASQVEALHEEYLQAGADIITTNTICADALSLAEYGLQSRSYELARAGAELARRVADKYSTTEHPRLVAGSVGPTTRNLTLANDTTAEQMAAVYADVIRGLKDGGVDIILIESVMDAANAKVAIEECRKIDADIPIILSAVLSRIAGRVASGATIAKFLEDLPLEEVAVVGFNCTNGPKPMTDAIKTLSAACDKPLVAYPAAGQPVVAANHFAKEMEQMCRAGLLNIVGGCCGTTPDYIAQLAKVAQRWRPRKVVKK
jgi:5-methyltetrahydrofolate--homocysteine methyltransferase